MGENTSRLMDGELDESRLDSVYRELKDPRERQEWDCYHLIGDCLRQRDIVRLPRSFASGEFAARVSAALAEEPVVLAPRPQRMKPAVIAWAAAAGVAAVGFVGWVALQPAGDQSVASVARVADEVRNAQVRRVSNVNDYVTIHQQYAPAIGMEKLRPFVRTVASPQEAPQ